MKVTLDGIEYETDNIPELSAEEMSQIMGDDEGTEKLLRAVERGAGRMREDNFRAVYSDLINRLSRRGVDSGTMSLCETLLRMGISQLEACNMRQQESRAIVNSICDELRSVTDFEGNKITSLNYLQGIRVLKEKIKELEYKLDMSKRFEENAVMHAMDRAEELSK